MYNRKEHTQLVCHSLNDCLQAELFDLFINGCGFRLCSSETLWKIDKPIPEKNDFYWRYAQNSDSNAIAKLYNGELENIYKPSLTRHPQEFQEPIFPGFSDGYKTRFVIEENKSIIGYFSIMTTDNLNYIFDMTINSGYPIEYSKVINAMLCEVARKKRAFYPLIKQKKYIKNSEDFGNYLKSMNYTPIQTQQILVKDYYKPIAQESANWNVFNFGENCVSNLDG